ncbi:hypothetical protein ACS386_09380 [Flavobacteriaceae bacterium LMO-SS05]
MLFTLEWGIKKSDNGYNGRVIWKFTNHTKTPVYFVTISNKEYTLSDGRKVSRSGEQLAYEVKPGETKNGSSPDSVNATENTGFWSDINNNPVVWVEAQKPVIRLAVEPKGQSYDWDNIGGEILSENDTDCNVLISNLDSFEWGKIKDWKLDKTSDLFDDDIAKYIAKWSVRASKFYKFYTHPIVGILKDVAESDDMGTPLDAYNKAHENAKSLTARLEEDISLLVGLKDDLKSLPPKYAVRIKSEIFHAKKRIKENRQQLSKELENVKIGLHGIELAQIYKKQDCRLKSLKKYNEQFTIGNETILKLATQIN